MILQLLILINLARVTPLKTDVVLTHIAEQRADYLCTHKFSHDGWETYESKFSYRGENLAKDFFTAKDIETAMLNSPTHKAVIVNKHYKYIGIANKCNITAEEFGG